MNTSVVLCPHPPLLFRELTGAKDVAASLRAACVDATRWLVSGAPDLVVVVGGADHPGPRDGSTPVGVRGFGTTAARTRGEALPPSLGVGRRLLDDAGWAGANEMLGVPWDASSSALRTLAADLAGRSSHLGLLLLGDGSARRGDKAPGFLDERAFGFDDTVAKALADGDVAALRDLDLDLARDLMVGGRSALRLLGHLGDPARAELSHRDDPFGVSYFVARWTFA